jgi:hypothetical protein
LLCLVEGKVDSLAAVLKQTMKLQKTLTDVFEEVQCFYWTEIRKSE